MFSSLGIFPSRPCIAHWVVVVINGPWLWASGGAWAPGMEVLIMQGPGLSYPPLAMGGRLAD